MPTRVTWDPDRYGTYSDERSRPFGDLVARIGATDARRVVDLGCGPGELTASLAIRWPHASILGIDTSESMIASAAPHASDQVHFQVGDAAQWSGAADTDVLITNATLHWVPDHLFLLDAWLRAMPSGSWLAMQVPANFNAPSHVLMRELAASARWRDLLDGVAWPTDAVAAPIDYWQVLTSAGGPTTDVDVWETTYLHVLPGTDPVLNWVRGAGLRPILQALGEEHAPEFEAQYAAELRLVYPTTEHGTVYPFTRRFAVAHKAA